MVHRIRKLRWGLVLLVAAVAAAGLSACGSSSSGAANSLLRQTFSGNHKVNSGTVAFNLTVNPQGSRTLNGPISLSFGGPFQSLGAGKLPESAFNISVAALGNSLSLTITSTGKSGYITFEGASYKLPQATYQRLASSFAQLASSPVSGNGSGVLGKLGINPLHWLQNPQVIGTESVGGASTTHIHAGINVDAFLKDLNTFLRHAASAGVSGASSFPNGFSASARQKIASEIQNPSFDVWTGQADKTIRKLEIGLSVPVSGSASTALGGLRSAGVGLSMQYGNLNQPQTITAPTTLAPYSQFQAKLKALLTQIQGGLGGVLGRPSSSSLSGAASPSGSASSAALQAYSQCVQSAHGSVAKVQKCAPLLGGQ